MEAGLKVVRFCAENHWATQYGARPRRHGVRLKGCVRWVIFSIISVLCSLAAAFAVAFTTG